MVEAFTVVNQGSSSQPSALLACRKVSTSFGKGPLDSSAVMAEERAVAYVVPSITVLRRVKVVTREIAAMSAGTDVGVIEEGSAIAATSIVSVDVRFRFLAEDRGVDLGGSGFVSFQPRRCRIAERAAHTCGVACGTSRASQTASAIGRTWSGRLSSFSSCCAAFFCLSSSESCIVTTSFASGTLTADLVFLPDAVTLPTLFATDAGVFRGVTPALMTLFAGVLDGVPAALLRPLPLPGVPIAPTSFSRLVFGVAGSFSAASRYPYSFL